ncbi:3-dehydroquinate dehydratase [Vagococcus lutrae]|uniref:type I 3-dehydroquinate dehydratase n=1 Tax=Vagococcus lutrae TaxID=81947 RepID=UPI001927EA50|nr:type I 3-dehydroquinate dehydratase [Vagococcus lutrae]GEQ62392.1 3-dehydroquinate dehydratase [Vagococcus lutrae]GEQ64298.1 3-dehydroquinate dehydratase [Vagococcus lutrae]GEQ66189.1 3-dehydroquinate dehydratase [Vagococcus lutrae]
MENHELVGKICVPLIASDESALFSMIDEAIMSGADILEWRVDYYPFQALEEIDRLLTLIQMKIGTVALIVTYRSVAEGGKGTACLDDYCYFCDRVVSHPTVTYLDVEWTKWKTVAKNSSIHNYLGKIILSKHDWTVGVEERQIQKTIQAMQRVQPAIMKVAVTPKDVNEGEELERMRKAYVFPNKTSSSALLLIGMGEWGRNLRISGHRWGNPWTFASLSNHEASAPGQLTVRELQELWRKGDDSR